MHVFQPRTAVQPLAGAACRRMEGVALAAMAGAHALLELPSGQGIAPARIALLAMAVPTAMLALDSSVLVAEARALLRRCAQRLEVCGGSHVCSMHPPCTHFHHLDCLTRPPRFAAGCWRCAGGTCKPVFPFGTDRDGVTKVRGHGAPSLRDLSSRRQGSTMQ